MYKKLKRYLNTVADVKPIDMGDGTEKLGYFSKYDGSYITLTGLENSVRYLMNRGITKELTHGVGYSPRKKKWYGWSHRAIYGFKIGSTVTKDDCGYFPTNKQDYIDSYIEFWTDVDNHKTVSVEDITEEGFNIVFNYNDTVPNESIRNTISSVYQEFPKQWGRGEWTAKTMDDAKQMAIDFCEGVS
jgi:hypothetical protein